MKSKIKFIHCSDIHLGANPYGIDERFEDMGKAFSQVVDYAIKQMVDFVIIAGDFFHKKNLDARTLEQAVNLLEPLKGKGIPVYMTEGNHDMATYTVIYSWLDFLNKKDYIHLLKPTMITETKFSLDKFNENKAGGYIETDDYIIVGLGYPGATACTMIEKLAEMYPEPNNKLLITMLHTGIDKFLTEGMGGLRESELECIVEKSDYIALGHIHNRYENFEKKYFNPGSVENVKIEAEIKDSSLFNKGFYLVNIDRTTKKIDYEFINTKVRNSFNEDIDLSILENTDEVNHFVIEYLKKNLNLANIDIEHGIVLQIKLKGTIKNGSTMVDVQEIKKTIKDNFNVIYVEVLNMLSTRETHSINMDNMKTRDEIDKEVISKLIKEEGFSDEDINKILPIILEMKELAKEGQLTLDKTEGQEIKKMIESII